MSFFFNNGPSIQFELSDQGNAKTYDIRVDTNEIIPMMLSKDFGESVVRMLCAILSRELASSCVLVRAFPARPPTKEADRSS